MTAILLAALLDLTHAFDKTTLYWPTGGGDFQLKQLHYGKTDAGFSRPRQGAFSFTSSRPSPSSRGS